MSSQSELAERSAAIQQKTFTNWVNMHLAKKGMKIEDLATDLRDGCRLLDLLSVISEDTIPKYVPHPKMRIQQVENINKALTFIEQHDVKLVNIGATEICDGNLKMTLGMIWTIILRFTIAGLSAEGLSAKEGLLLWCQRKTAPYDNVKVVDFSGSFQDGLAFCALIHRHRPDLLDYDKLTAEDKAGNLDLAFKIGEEHLGIPRLIDVEDIVSMPRPEERSIMTYVAQLYKVFSSLDQVETAGRRVSKFVDFAKEISDLIHDYEQRTRALIGHIDGKVSEFGSAGLAQDYAGAKALIAEFRQYRKTTKREWVREQSDLAALFTQIQAKLSSMNRPAYVPPSGLAVRDVEGKFEVLNEAEHQRRKKLNASLREILDNLRQAFATPANAFYDQVQEFKKALANVTGELEDRLNQIKSNQGRLQGIESQLPGIEQAEKDCDAANIEENEYSDHTYDDLAFEFTQTTSAYQKAVYAIESQIAAKSQEGKVSAEQLEEFKKTFDHFDDDRNGTLSRLELKSALSGLGLVELDFEGGDKKFDAIFQRVSGGNDNVTFQQFVDYMVSVTADSTSPEQLTDSFSTIAGGKQFVTVNDLKVAGLSGEQVAYLTSVLPAGPQEGTYDYKTWLQNKSF